MCPGFAGKREYPHLFEEEAHLDPFPSLPGKLATLDSVEQLVMADGRDGEVRGTVPLRTSDCSLMPSQEMDTGIGVQQVGHSRISLDSPWLGR